MDGPIQRGGFRCYTDSIDADASPVRVQAGDILGACIFNPVNERFLTRSQLDIVGERSGSSLLATTTDGCSMDTLPSNIPASQLLVLNSRRLHIHANMGMYIVDDTFSVIIRFCVTTEPTSTVQPASKTVVSTIFPSAILSAVTTPDPSSTTKSTNKGKTSAVLSASVLPTSTMSYYSASSTINMHSLAVHVMSTPAPKQSSETPGMSLTGT